MSRFDCASVALELRGLLAYTRKTWWAGLAAAVALHLGLSFLGMARQEERVAKPLTTQFVKRAPRLTKPLELKKRPTPRRRQMQRQMVSVRARTERGQMDRGFQSLRMVQNLARPQASISRGAGLAQADLEPQAVAQAIWGAKEAKDAVDMALEMVDIQALDTGQYHALVVQDPQDKRSIKGFCRLGVIYSDNMYGEIQKAGVLFEAAILPAFLRLADTMNRYTDIKTDIFGRITLDDAELFKTPWVYFMAFSGFELSESELRTLGRYATSGGFVFADTYWVAAEHRGGSLGVVRSIRRALELQGLKEVAFQVLPNRHPVYHCYFDFDGPPPGAGGETAYGIEYLEGMEIDGRLSVILSKKAYYGPSSHYGTKKFGGDYANRDPERALQFGVNLVIFALTQEGSITHQVMQQMEY